MVSVELGRKVVSGTVTSQACQGIELSLQNAISGISQSGPRYLTGEITLRVDISPHISIN